jgi:predicted transposase YbfD/YdcC
VDMAEFAEDKEEFLRGFLNLEHGPPSHDTFSRVLRLLDPDQFRACFQRFMARFAETAQGVVAIDGKVLRRSFDSASGKSALHMVTAWGCDQRLVLAQIATAAKSNEITAVPKLLEMLSLKGTIVTVDALNCQRDIARRIVDQDGDYVLALKGNQGTLHADVKLFLDDPETRPTDAHTTVDGDHGRIETRACSVSTDIGWLQEVHDWPGLAAIGKVIRTRETSAKVTTETACYLLSAPVSAERFGQIARSHWALPALVPRRHHERGQCPQSPRQRPLQPRHPAPHGPQSHPQGAIKGLPARQDQACRMEGHIPRQSPRSNLKCDCPAHRPRQRRPLRRAPRREPGQQSQSMSRIRRGD